MIGGLLLLGVSLTLLAFAAINLRNCITKGTTSAYGDVYSRAVNPAAFWVSATCSVLAILFAMTLAGTALAGLSGLIGGR